MSEKGENANLGFIEPSSNAKIEGVITSLSPMPSGKTCNYYNEQITDNHSSVRFCGFDSNTRRRLEESYENSEAVLLDKIKKARQGDNLEIIVKKGTEILKSQKLSQFSRETSCITGKSERTF